MADHESAISMLRIRLPGVLAVYRFGSEATGDVHRESDLDLAMLLDSVLDPVERWELQEDLARQLGRPVDLVDLRAASTVLRMQVVSTGTRLFTGDLRRVGEFEMFVFSDYCRLNEERRGILLDIKRRGRVHA
jgi:uncharacterized protein